MVMRYWGAPDVRAETFEALVDRAAGGIRAQDLLDDLRRRGWRAESFRGDKALMSAQLNRGQPVIALIEDRPGAFHFVVVAARANGRIVYHDPARAPYRVVDEAAFDAAWQKSDRWTMLLLPAASAGAGVIRPTSPEPGVSRPPLPAAGVSSPDSPVGAGFSRPSPCEAMVREAVAVAGAGDKPAALRMLASAADLCPRDSAPHREAAGIHALEERWPEAVAHARAAVARDPGDQHAWQIVAAGEYVGGDPRAALEAWNAAGEPRIDLVTVQGLTRTRHSVASALLDLPPDVVLTSQRLAAAEKRLGELPAAEVARVNYRPQPGGRANIEAMVVERPLLPTLRSGLIKSGIGAIVDREVSLTASSPTGGGETVRAAWRWWEARPRLSLAYPRRPRSACSPQKSSPRSRRTAKRRRRSSSRAEADTYRSPPGPRVCSAGR